MRKTCSIAPRLLSLLALGVLTAPAVAGGCGGNSSKVAPTKSGTGGTGTGTGGTTSGRGGTSGSGTGGAAGLPGAGGKSAQGGTMNVDDGGDAGEAAGGTVGVTGGTAGAATAGAGADAGSGGSAGTSGGANQGGTAGQPGGTAGQSSGTAGQGGAAGNGTAGMIGVLGTACSPPGALACAGNHQKLTVLCGGTGEWEPNQTCGVDLYCDSTPGPNVGLCQPVAEGCDDGPGTVFCSVDEKQIVTCGPDAVTRSEVTCDGACHRGVCRDDGAPCPDWDEYDDGTACAKDCGEPDVVLPGQCAVGNGGCYGYVVAYDSATVRTPWSADACACGMEEGKVMVLSVDAATQYLRITVPPPWSLGACGEEAVHCAVVPYKSMNIWTPALDAGPVNILVEEVNPGATCPQ